MVDFFSGTPWGRTPEQRAADRRVQEAIAHFEHQAVLSLARYHHHCRNMPLDDQVDVKELEMVVRTPEGVVVWEWVYRWDVMAQQPVLVREGRPA